MINTVLLTGITGFIGKRIAQQLMREGYAVRGTLRGLRRFDEVRASLRDGTIEQPLTLKSLDLLKDEGWDDAMKGVDAVIHVASPFPAKPPTDPQELIRPAVLGTKRVLNAAARAGVSRVIITSSMSAIMHSGKQSGYCFGPEDWSDPDHPSADAFAVSKTLSEKTAWDIARQNPDLNVTAINPGLVCGTPADSHFGTSLKFIDDILSGRDVMLPNIGLPIVDVADVAALHVNALTNAASAGKRFIAADTFWMLPTLAKVLRGSFPGRKITQRVTPRVFLHAMAVLNPALKPVLAQADKQFLIDNSETVRTFNRPFISASDSVVASGSFLAKLSA